MVIRLSFHGAAGTVTGSRHLLETEHGTVLVDAGLFQGLKKLRLLNWEPPAFDPSLVDHMLLTHGHIDHVGYLPRLVRLGFRAPVWCSVATTDLAPLLLRDAARIQEEDAEHANRRGYSKHRPALPLFTEDDAERAIRLMEPVPYGRWFSPTGGLRARFSNAGHILGSASAEVRVERDGGELSVEFSGDVGKYHMPLHPDPKPPPPSDFLVVESTYGDREHDPAPFLEQVGKPIRRALLRGGIVLVPAFAVARSQLVTLLLREGMKAGVIPEVPVHIDSPMAVDATRIYSRHMGAEDLDPELVAEHRCCLFPKRVSYHRTVDESKALNGLPGPRVIISASGMLTAGRVLHHLRRILPDERNLLMLVGYQAAGTRGRALLDGKRKLRMHGRDVPVRAEFVVVHGLSAHADRRGLLRWTKGAGRAPKGIFVVHGEPESARSLSHLLTREVGSRSWAPELGDSYDLEALLNG